MEECKTIEDTESMLGRMDKLPIFISGRRPVYWKGIWLKRLIRWNFIDPMGQSGRGR
jgi:hypothetical protein